MPLHISRRHFSAIFLTVLNQPWTWATKMAWITRRLTSVPMHTVLQSLPFCSSFGLCWRLHFWSNKVSILMKIWQRKSGLWQGARSARCSGLVERFVTSFYASSRYTFSLCGPLWSSLETFKSMETRSGSPKELDHYRLALFSSKRASTLTVVSACKAIKLMKKLSAWTAMNCTCSIPSAWRITFKRATNKSVTCVELPWR